MSKTQAEPSRKISSLDLLKFLALPVGLLPKARRGGVGYCILTLGVGLDDSRSLADAWRFVRGWFGMLPALCQAGQALSELKPQLYERVWKNVQGHAPVEEMLAWVRRAVNTGPSSYGFSATVFVHEGLVIWGPCHFKLSETRALLAQLQAFLEREPFTGEDVWLTVFPKATLSGVPLRSLAN